MEERKSIKGISRGVVLSKPQEGKRYQIYQKGKTSLFKTEKQAINFYNNYVKKGSGAQIKDVFEKQNEEFKNFFKNPEVYKRYYKGPLTASSIKDIWISLPAAQRRSAKSLFNTKIKNINESNKLKKQGYIKITDLTNKLNRSSSMELMRTMRDSKKFKKLFPNYLKGTVTDSNNKLWIKTNSETLKKLKEWAEDPFAKGLRESTIQNVKKAYQDKRLMNYWNTWKVGNLIDQKLIDSVLGKQGSAYTMMQLGRTLQGKEPIDGIKKNVALGNKIIEAVRYKAKEYGDWHTAAYKYAKQDMDTFLPPGKKGITFGDYQRLLTKSLKEVGLENFQIDEINALRTGVRGGTQPYSVFSQILEGKYNQGVKRRFDAENAKNQMKLNFALSMKPNETIKIKPTAVYSNKARNPVNLNKTEYIDYVINLQNDLVDNFFEKVPDLKGKISLPKFDLRDPKTVYGSRFNTFDEGVQNAILKNFKEVGYTLDVGKKALTQKELLNSIKNFSPQQKTNFLKRFGKYGILSGLGLTGLTGFTDINAYANVKNENQTDQQLETAQADQYPELNNVYASASMSDVPYQTTLQQQRTPITEVADISSAAKVADDLMYDNVRKVFVKRNDPEVKADQSDILYWLADNVITESPLASIGVGATALSIPGAKETFDAARKADKGVLRSTLGVLGKGLTRVGSPAGTALFEVPFIAEQIQEGRSPYDILSDPLNYIGPAFTESLTRGAGAIKGPPRGFLGGVKDTLTFEGVRNPRKAAPGLLNLALRLGLSPRNIALISGTGAYGAIAATGLTAFDLANAYRKGELDNLFSSEEEDTSGGGVFIPGEIDTTGIMGLKNET